MILVRHGQSAFNAVFNATRRDPGIPDPRLTPEGRRQARAAAARLETMGIARLVCSPYTRALETAAEIAGALGLSVTVDPLVRERTAFVCDVGTPRARLDAAWPTIEFAAFDEHWWHAGEEPEHALQARCRRFRDGMAALADWRRVAVVSHWGFIRALTGRTVANGEMVRFDPTPGSAGGSEVAPFHQT